MISNVIGVQCQVALFFTFVSFYTSLAKQSGDKLQSPPFGHLNWGIAGAGHIAHRFAGALHNVGGKLLAIAARKQAAACVLAAKHEAQCFGGYEALTTIADLTIVYVATIHPTHHSISIMLLNAGLHVVVEKPMAMNVRQTTQMIHAFRGLSDRSFREIPGGMTCPAAMTHFLAGGKHSV